MGQSESSFQRTYTETVSQLSSVQLGEIAARFNELYGKAGGPRGHVVDREAFSRYFKLPVAVGDRLFNAFDRKKVMEASWPAVIFMNCYLSCTLLPPYPPCLNLEYNASLSQKPLGLSYLCHLYFVMDSIRYPSFC